MNVERFKQIQAENARLCEERNAAYGDYNLVRFGARGVVIRMADKMERLINLVVNGGDEPGGERATDNARDLANYATILQLLLEGTFEGPKSSVAVAVVDLTDVGRAAEEFQRIAEEVGDAPKRRRSRPLSRPRGRVGRRGRRRPP